MSVDGEKTPLTNKLKVSVPTFISGVNGDLKPVRQQGTWALKTQNGDAMKLTKTLDLKGSTYDLLSVGLLDDAGLEVTFAGGKGVVTNPADGEVLLVAPKSDGLYRLQPQRVKVHSQAPQHMVNWDVGSLLSATKF